MNVVDLFSGTGAATQAFRDRGHKVVTIDIARNKWCKPDIQADIRHLPLRNLKPDFVWASPPCTEFSFARRVPGDVEAGLNLLAAAYDAIAALDATYWAIENVHGAKKWFGPPTKTVGAWCLWGRFPPFDARVPKKFEMAGVKKLPRAGGGWMYGGANASRKAKAPYALSLALCCAIERDML